MAGKRGPKQQAGQQEQEAERSHQETGRAHWKNHQALDSEPTFNDTLLPARPHFLNFPNTTTAWRLSVQILEPTSLGPHRIPPCTPEFAEVRIAVRQI